MSKGMWHLIGYPESMKPLEDVLNVLRGSGARVAYILHDKDTYREDVVRDGVKVHSAGDLKKSHYHFLCGWTNGFPDWDKLHDICEECKIPLGRFKDVKVQDEPESLDYLTHPEEKYPDKYHYSLDELHLDPGFDPDAYITAAKRRKMESKAAGAEKSADFLALFEVVRKSGLDEWHELFDMLVDSRPDMVETLLSNAYPIKAYLDSKRNAFATRKGYEAKIKSYVDRAERVEKLVSEISLERDALARDNDALRSNLAFWIAQSGEPSVPEWEINVSPLDWQVIDTQ